MTRIRVPFFRKIIFFFLIVVSTHAFSELIVEKGISCVESEVLAKYFQVREKLLTGLAGISDKYIDIDYLKSNSRLTLNNQLIRIAKFEQAIDRLISYRVMCLADSKAIINFKIVDRNVALSRHSVDFKRNGENWVYVASEKITNRISAWFDKEFDGKGYEEITGISVSSVRRAKLEENN